MPTVIDPVKLANIQAVADKLASLPQEALIYIAGYAEGCRDWSRKDSAISRLRPNDCQTNPSRHV